MEHRIKLKQQYCDPVFHGEKTFEVRNNDRGYQKGDYIVFIPVDENGQSLAFHPIEKEKYVITYVHSGYGLKEGYVVFGIEDVKGLKDNMDIDDLGLSTRARNSLVRSGIKTVKALEGLTYYELLRLRNMGKKTAEEIEAKMKKIKGEDWQFFR